MNYLTEDNIDVLKQEKPIIVDFYADWCGPCQMLGPVFEELSKEMPEVDFYKCDTMTQGNIATEFGIRGIPALVIMKNGKEVDRIIGFKPKDAIKQTIKEAL